MNTTDLTADQQTEVSIAGQRKCKCGFVFSDPGEYRNHEAHQDINKQWWSECPTCGRIHKAD